MADQTFTSGQILTAAQMSQLQANIGLTYIDTVTWSSGAATQSFDSKFTSSFQNYRIILNIDGTSNDAQLSGQMRASTTPTTSNYKVLTFNGYPGIGSPSANGSNAASAFDMGLVSQPDTICSFDLYRPQIAKITILDGMTDNIQSAFSNSIQWFNIFGHLNDTTAYDGMQFTVSGGTFTGSAVIYGYRKA
jgi:uncharacterized alpha/beta hydrolase family protein